MRFPNGSTRVGFLTVLSITEYICFKNELDLFFPYQLDEAGLLLCMPALGDRIRVDFDEVDNALRAYMIF